MSEMFAPEEVRIDNESQLMLRELRGEDWERALTLRRAADLGENRQVFYRMENYLIPGGLVEERERESADDVRLFRLTPRGAEWVEDHADELERPTTREQVQEYALEGYKAGTSARESVQKYRKKVNRMKRRIERAEETVEEIGEAQESADRNNEYLRERTQAVRERSISNRNRLETVEEDLKTRATIDGLEVVRDGVKDAERRLTRLEAKQRGIARQQAATERSRAELRALANSARYVAAGSVVVYLVLLVVVYLLAPGLVASAVIAGIVVALGIGFAGGAALYARGARSPSASVVDRSNDEVRAPTE